MTPAKQRRVILTAEYWLDSHRTELLTLIDVFEIFVPYGERTLFPKINHLEDAFQ